MRTLALALVLAACSAPTTASIGSSSSSSSSGSSGSSGGTFTCVLGARGNLALKTTYECASQSAFDACALGNATKCTPKDKKRGTVGAGGACAIASTPTDAANQYELADDCAPIAGYGGQGGSAKGSFCASGYCTHACQSGADCTDLGQTASCGGGVCAK